MTENCSLGETRKTSRKRSPDFDFETILQETSNGTIRWIKAATNVHLARYGKLILMLDYYRGWRTFRVFDASLNEIGYVGDPGGTE